MVGVPTIVILIVTLSQRVRKKVSSVIFFITNMFVYLINLYVSEPNLILFVLKSFFKKCDPKSKNRPYGAQNFRSTVSVQPARIRR